MLTRTVSRRRGRAAPQGARGDRVNRVEAEEKIGEAAGGDGRLPRAAGAGRKRAAVVGEWEGTGGEAREAMGGEGSTLSAFPPLLSHPSPLGIDEAAGSE